MKTNKIVYWITTGLMLLIFTFSASMYLINYERAASFFVSLGFPTWLIYPLAIAKILGILVILYRKPIWLKEWVYAGFFFDAVLALTAHLTVSDGQHGIALIALIAIVSSRYFYNKVYLSNKTHKA